jgi:hypothetical protein
MRNIKLLLLLSIFVGSELHSRETENSFTPEEENAIQKKYIEIRDNFIAGNLSAIPLFKVFKSALQQLAEDPNEAVKKQDSIKSFIRSANEIEKNENLLVDQSDAAKSFRKILFIQIQKLLEMQDLITTKYALGQALEGINKGHEEPDKVDEVSREKPPIETPTLARNQGNSAKCRSSSSCFPYRPQRLIIRFLGPYVL